jgi:hypothetical protein
MKDEITIKEAKSKKAVLQSEILSLITKFEIETGLHVSDIGFSRNAISKVYDYNDLHVEIIL